VGFNVSDLISTKNKKFKDLNGVLEKIYGNDFTKMKKLGLVRIIKMLKPYVYPLPTLAVLRDILEKIPDIPIKDKAGDIVSVLSQFRISGNWLKCHITNENDPRINEEIIDNFLGLAVKSSLLVYLSQNNPEFKSEITYIC
jgi:hypothetical protein